MTGIASVLKGVQPDLRDTIRRLHEEGWNPSKTNGGHIRLEHADAAKPVFTSSTPSDFRTPLNLLRDCRSALMGTARPPDAPAPLIGPQKAAEILSSHKRKRRRSGRAGSPALPVAISPRIGPDVAKNEESGRGRPPVSDTASPPEHQVEPPNEAPSDDLNPALNAHQKELTEMNMIARPEIETATRVVEVAPPAAPAPARKRTVRTAAARNSGAPIRTARPPVTAPVQTPAALPLDEEAVRIGMMIARGELTALVITPGMVGQTLVFLQAPYLIGARVEAGSSAAPRIIRRNVAFNDRILDFLRTFPGEDVPMSMIAEHMVSRGHYKPKSARVGVRSRLEQLVEDGSIRLIDGPGEPHARLLG